MVEDPAISITSRENMMRKSWEDLLRKKDFKTHLNDEKLRKSFYELSQLSDLEFKSEKMQEVTLSLSTVSASSPILSAFPYTLYKGYPRLWKYGTYS